MMWHAHRLDVDVTMPKVVLDLANVSKSGAMLDQRTPAGASRKPGRHPSTMARFIERYRHGTP